FLKHTGTALPADHDTLRYYQNNRKIQFENLFRFNFVTVEEVYENLLEIKSKTVETLLKLFWKISARQIYVTMKDNIGTKVAFWRRALHRTVNGQLHNRTRQVKNDLTTFAYEVQSLAKRA
ncbi:unnamed protein product, partial [Callosobruchus maculatus]